jgi:adenine-specific DNA-methyltransferase
MSTEILEQYLNMEEQLIALEIEKRFISDKTIGKVISSADTHLINANLLLTDEDNIAYSIHKRLINALVTVYIELKFKKTSSKLKNIFTRENDLLNKIDTKTHYELLPNVAEEIHVAFLNSEFTFNKGKVTRKKSKHHLKETGAVYTLSQITNEIVSNTIGNAIKGGVSPFEITCLDFASGTGRFYFEAIHVLNTTYSVPIEKIITNNLFAVDMDETAVSILRLKVLSLLQKLTAPIINALSKNIIVRNALMPNAFLFSEDIKNIDLNTDFISVLDHGGFDTVVSNPPYCLLKVNKKSGQDQLIGYYSKLQARVQNEINYFRTSGVYQYSIEGMLNYYQLSIEMIIRLTKLQGQIGIICPASIFADLTSAKLRKHLLTSNKLIGIRYFPESARLFENVAQSTVIFYLQKGTDSTKIDIDIASNSFSIQFETVKNIFSSNYEIPLIDKIGWSILSKISKHKKIKEYSYIRNRRGELDLTLFKSFITSEDTGSRLVRGNMISDKGVIDKNAEFVDIKNFLNKKSEDFRVNDHNKKRLICQQISNIDCQRRLKFVFSKKSDILGNSCNYIVSTRGSHDLEKLKIILNSSLMNWRFKITSSNNHINNYELDELPLLDLDQIDMELFSNDVRENDEVICALYGLNEEETDFIIGSEVSIGSSKIYEKETV